MTTPLQYPHLMRGLKKGMEKRQQELLELT
jgi:hypothetical protein